MEPHKGKMESLVKYVPFIDFVLGIDQQKYIKFINIRKWILQKKNYPLSDFNKIEQSIITQYKNLLLENNVQIPQHITHIFAPVVSKQFVNLCSDDEDDESQNIKENNVKNSTKSLNEKNKYQTHYKPKSGYDSEDDDLEFIGVEYISKKDSEKENTSTNKPNTKQEAEIDDVSNDILSRIDQLAADDLRIKNLVHEPISYTFKQENKDYDRQDNKVAFQRRSTDSKELFKRRADFEDEVVVENLNKNAFSYCDSPMEIVAIDSDSDTEPSNNDDRPSTSRAAKSIETNAKNSTNDANKKDERFESLCSSTDTVSPNMNNILVEAKDVTNESKTSGGGSDKENSNCSRNKPNLTPEQLSKILEDISSKTDLELDTFYEAIAYVSQLNTGQGEPHEIPPPAPPIATNLPSSSLQPSNLLQQQTPLNPPLTPYPQNSNSVPTGGVAPARPKISINDPRIKKQLQVIKNSPLYTYNLLNADIEANIKRICQAQSIQLPQPEEQNSTPPNVKKANTVSNPRTSAGTHKSSISYGEYKRRQLEKKLQLEKEREEQKAKAEAEAEAQKQRDREKLELPKNKEEDVRSKLLSTLSPCKEQLTAFWNRKMNSTSSFLNAEQTQQKENNTVETNNESEVENTLSSKNDKQSKNKKQANPTGNNKNADQKLNRIYNELKCTFKGFDQIQDYIAEESDQTKKVGATPKLIGLKRRSSIHALSAISEQLGQRSPDSSDSESNWKRSAPNADTFGQDSTCSVSKRIKTAEILRPNKRAKALRILDDDDTSVESISNDEEATKNENKVTNENLIEKELVIKLHRISEDFIRKHTKRVRKDAETLESVRSIELNKSCEKIQTLKERSQKIPKLKKYNNDCQMTERNTVFCVLCRSKPSDLTNHYIGRHKTESYVSRLDWSELEDLEYNTRFAKLQSKTKNYRFERYEVECLFCKEKLSDQFINLYNHYSAHTGEYAFQCSHCHLAKPYRPDIQSHILHSKPCRNASIQVMYRYPPQAQCIYLHYCKICNFVQLNEANVLKHLREHHDQSKAITRNIQKCILAAISDGPDVNEAKKSPSPITIPTTLKSQEKATLDQSDYDKICGEINKFETIMPVAKTEINFKVDDDDIKVSNEPCSEDFDEANISLDEQLKQMHEGPSVKNVNNNPLAITVIHNFEINSATESKVPNVNSAEDRRHFPIKIKSEPADGNSATLLPTSTDCKTKQELEVNQQILRKYSVYEKYRSYPENVNYLGLYKCMIDDCYYSTDCSEEIFKHLTEHVRDNSKPNEYLQCPYCVISLNIPITPSQLVDHVRTQHENMSFQCSICCYRSCNASNVQIHQQIHHKNAHNTCKIYKCSAENNRTLDLNKQIEKNIFMISCKFCNTGFYHTILFINHLQKEHKMFDAMDLRIYSCIYCPFTVDNKNLIRIHVATKHPDEPPLIYDHNAQITDTNQDCKSLTNIVDISESVEWIQINPTVCSDTDQIVKKDVKPDFKQLLRMNEEIVKVRLQKLTSHTGVPPDSLYRCPETTCGGFFSNFELWLRHMKLRHHALECQCPHCRTEILLPLEQYALHFEQHRRHTFICFHCTTTNPSETLASQHATLMHSDFGAMRCEQISFNPSYSYSVMIKSDLLMEREQFITEFMDILQTRLKELQDNENKCLKQQWPVQDNTPWIDDYLQILFNRKVARRCLVKECTFITVSEETLYRHLSTSHTIQGTQFNCSKCDYRVEKCKSLDELFNHIKLHNEYIFICSACSLNTSSRSKMSSHIAEQHSARDVPVIHLFKNGEQMYIKIDIVFSDNHLTFSTMKNCFCCSEQNMGGDVFSLHLKHYHKLTFNYYCEKCTNNSFKSLKEVKPHFEQFHKTNTFKIRCELASRTDLDVTSLNDFHIKIFTSNTQPSLHIKNEPLDVSDDDVTFIEDDDVEIQNALKEDQLKKPHMPKLKCASFSKLVKPSTNTLTLPSVLPSTSATFKSYMLPICVNQSQFTSAPLSTAPLSTAVAVIPQTSAAVIPQTSAAVISQPPVLTNNTYIPYNNRIILTNNNNAATQITAVPSYRISFSGYNQHVPNSFNR